jgi:hypothetical protein
MSLAITLVAAVLICIVGSVAYHQGKKQSDGCNGHHWGDEKPYHQMSARERNLTYPNSIPQKHSYTQSGRVHLRIDGGKKCRDCGEWEQCTLQIGDIACDKFGQAKEGALDSQTE